MKTAEAVTRRSSSHDKRIGIRLCWSVLHQHALLVELAVATSYPRLTTLSSCAIGQTSGGRKALSKELNRIGRWIRDLGAPLDLHDLHERCSFTVAALLLQSSQRHEHPLTQTPA